ncbi:uncharacterized protein UTRI_04778 [Ustilago trichophora]|uniref:Serine hydrolase FSH domain-containing protein n=1 Tax=Ustilago trichophora TaxID=86804 RepID=A0A5C3EFQ6_9BASI|nr:uncharacterized protein UTRI_04778 [Ustilago trichophora]
MTPTTDRPLDLTWDAPLPHALTRTRTYLSVPSSSTQVAIIAIHGRGDNARDFAEAFVPHLRSYFGSHLLGEVDEEDSPAVDSKSDGEKGLKITLRALEARDGIWFGTHTPKSEDDLAFQGPYVHSSLLKLQDEIESLHRMGIPHSKTVLVGFSQGAIIVNSYLLRALQLLPLSKHVKVENGELVNSPLPIPANILGWAEAVSSEISKAGERVTKACSGLLVVKSSVEMERGAHSVLPGMIAKLIQMVQAAAAS